MACGGSGEQREDVPLDTGLACAVRRFEEEILRFSVMTGPQMHGRAMEIFVVIFPNNTMNMAIELN